MAKLLVFLTSALIAPVVKSRTAVTLNSSVKVCARPAVRRSPLDEVRDSILIWLEGNSLLKKSFADREKSVNLAIMTRLYIVIGSGLRYMLSRSCC